MAPMTFSQMVNVISDYVGQTNAIKNLDKKETKDAPRPKEDRKKDGDDPRPPRCRNRDESVRDGSRSRESSPSR